MNYMLKAKQRIAKEVTLDGIKLNNEYLFDMDFVECEERFTTQELSINEGFRFLRGSKLKGSDLKDMTFESLMNLESPYFLFTYSIGYTATSKDIIIIKKQYALNGTGEPRTTCYPVPAERDAAESIYLFNDDFEIGLFDAVKICRMNDMSLEEFCQLETCEMQHLFDYYLVIGY